MNQALNRLLKENKTAFYVFDIEKLKARIAHLQAALPPEVVLCYAVKANTFITKELIDTIHRFEVCSPGEAEICRAVGVPSENMVISGVYKTPEVMEAMVADLDFQPHLYGGVFGAVRAVPAAGEAVRPHAASAAATDQWQSVRHQQGGY